MVNIKKILQKGAKSFEKDTSKTFAEETLQKTQKILDEGKTVPAKEGGEIPKTITPPKQAETETVVEEVLKKGQKFPKAKPGAAKQYLEAYDTPVEAKTIEDLFNVNTIKGPDDVKAGLQKLSQIYKTEFTKQRRGVQTFDDLDALANDIGKHPEGLSAHILGLKPGETFNSETIYAARKLLDSQVRKLDLLAEKAATEGSTTDLIKYKEQLSLTSELSKNILGVRTETGRALSQFRKATDEGMLDLDTDLVRKNQLLMELGGPDEIRLLAKTFKNLKTKNKKLQFAKDLGNKTFAGKVSDALSQAMINIFLSNPYTLVKNTVGNWVSQAMIRNERKRAAKFLDDGLPLEDQVRKHEDIALAYGIHASSMEMWSSFAKSLTRENLSVKKQSFGLKFPDSDIKIGKVELRNDDAFSANAFNMKRNNNLQKFSANAVDTMGRIATLNSIPTRFLNSTDAFYKNRMYRGELYALAFRDGMTKYEQGLLKKDKLPDYIASLIQNPTDAMRSQAQDAARYATFTTKLGTEDNMFHGLGKGLQTLKYKLDFMGWLGNYYLPFVQTPVNITQFSLERFPAMNRLVKNHQIDLKGSNGPAAQQLALAKQETGRMFFMAFAPLGYLGYASGSDVKLGTGKEGLELRRAKNYQPKSLRIPVGDEIIQINLTGNDPIAIMMAMAADTGALFGQISKDHDEAKDYLDFTMGMTLMFGENILNSNNMVGVAKAVEHINMLYESKDKAKAGKKWLEQFFSSLVPTGARQLGKMLPGSSEFEQVKTEFGDYMYRNIYEADMYDDYDFLGEKIAKFGVVTKIKNSEILDEVERLELRIPRMRKTYSKSNVYPGVDVSIPLTSEQVAFSKKLAGDITKKELTKLFKGQPPYGNFYANAAEIEKESVILDIISAAREDARKQMYLEYRKEMDGAIEEAANEKIIHRQRSIPLESLEQ